MKDIVQQLRKASNEVTAFNANQQLCADAAAVIKRMRAALKEYVARCPNCGGTGTAYTHEDETQVGCVPGSSGVDCVECTVQRAALRSNAEQSVEPTEKPPNFREMRGILKGDVKP